METKKWKNAVERADKVKQEAMKWLDEYGAKKSIAVASVGVTNRKMSGHIKQKSTSVKPRDGDPRLVEKRYAKMAETVKQEAMKWLDEYGAQKSIALASVGTTSRKVAGHIKQKSTGPRQAKPEDPRLKKLDEEYDKMVETVKRKASDEIDAATEEALAKINPSASGKIDISELQSRIFRIQLRASEQMDIRRMDILIDATRKAENEEDRKFYVDLAVQILFNDDDQEIVRDYLLVRSPTDRVARDILEEYRRRDADEDVEDEEDEVDEVDDGEDESEGEGEDEYESEDEDD